MNLTNDTILTRASAAAGAISKMPQKELLAVPMPDFVDEYNRTRNAFVALNPSLSDSAPPEVLDPCRYVEILAYYEQIRGLMKQVMKKW